MDGDECAYANIFCLLVFKGHSLGGSSIASLSVSKKCTFAFAPAGRATRWALPRFLVVRCRDIGRKSLISTYPPPTWYVAHSLVVTSLEFRQDV